MNDLTRRQRVILEVIYNAIQDNGYPPSVREIGKHTNLTSPSSVSHQLAALEQKKYIERDPGSPRAIRLTERATELFNASEITYDKTSRNPTGTSSVTKYDNTQTSLEIVNVPILGSIAAGNPILATEHHEGHLQLSFNELGRGDFFALHVKGDSMIDAGINDNDIVVIKHQPTAHDGDIVAALLDDEATVKTFATDNGHPWLLPANKDYRKIDARNASIMGKVVMLIRKFY